MWAGILRNGTADIAIFTGIMDSSSYQTIMKEKLLPFIARTYSEYHRLVKDNDPKHRSKSTVSYNKCAAKNAPMKRACSKRCRLKGRALNKAPKIRARINKGANKKRARINKGAH